jgi:hypothetical protein
VLATLARALRLDEDQQRYLYELAGKADARPRRRRPAQRVRPADPVIRGMHREWEHDARDAVAALRMEAAADPDDPELARLVGELSVRDAEFRTWWAEHRVTSSSHGTKLYRHRLVGDLTLDCDMWTNPDGSGQRLMVLTAEPGSPSHDALRILTSWTAGQPNANLVEGRNP